MSEMVERVARAFVEAQGMTWDRCLATTKSISRHQARVAIEAMREPTEAMVKAGADEVVSHAWSAAGEHVADPETVWSAMIAATLRETPAPD